MAPPIYLDHHSTTPCDARVVEKMLPWFTEKFGNPASITHRHGREAAAAVEEARSAVADFLGVRSSEVYFTSGATEANNIAIGLAARSGAHVITTAIEHKSVLEPVRQLARSGVEITLLQPDDEGFVTAEAVREAIRPSTALVSVQAANSEIGTIEPVAEIAAVCRSAGVAFHTDATQAVGRIPLDTESIDLLSLSAHKFYGPKGIGAVVVRRGVLLQPLTRGGGQEKGLRAGTVNVPGVIGLAAALEIRRHEMATEAARLRELRDHLRERLLAVIDGTSIHGPRELRLPGNLNVSFDRVEAEALMLALRRFSLSSGSACSSGDREPSHVLRAIGLSDERAMGSLRIGLGAGNDMSHVELLVSDLESSVARLREISVG